MVTGMGRLREREFVPGERYKFTSKEQDPETGLYYFGARYYEPRLSRWISTDPAAERYLPGAGKGDDGLPGKGGIFNPGNNNLYSYCVNNPVKHIDPDGNTWTGNVNFLIDWVTGGGDQIRNYSFNSVELQEMRNSPGAAALRNSFYAGGFKSINRAFRYGTGQAYWD